MRSLRHATGLVVLTAVASCNAIIGVEDVHPQSSKTKPAGSSTKPGDDDDTTGTTPTGQPTTNPTGTNDSGPPPATACGGPSNLACERIVFVTHDAFTGNLGGTHGADDKCNAAAAKNPALSGLSFRAWISEFDGEMATSRLPQGTKAYKRTDGVVIANSWTDLVDGTIAAQLQVDEMGKTLAPAAGLDVWTGTKPDGSGDGTNDCVGWVSDDTLQSGAFGDSSTTDGSWTDLTTESCNAPNHLYCLEY